MNLTNIPNFSWGFCHASRMFIFDKDLATNVASLWCFQTLTRLCKVLTLLRRGCLSTTILNKILASAFTLQVWLLLVLSPPLHSHSCLSCFSFFWQIRKYKESSVSQFFIYIISSRVITRRWSSLNCSFPCFIFSRRTWISSRWLQSALQILLL